MKNFNWSKAAGFGILIWLIMFAVTSAMAGFKVNMDSPWWTLGIAVLSGVLSYAFAKFAVIQRAAHAVGYGLAWAALGILLDIIISRQFAPGIFNAWQYWLGYALVLLAPWLELETLENRIAI